MMLIDETPSSSASTWIRSATPFALVLLLGLLAVITSMRVWFAPAPSLTPAGISDSAAKIPPSTASRLTPRVVSDFVTYYVVGSRADKQAAEEMLGLRETEPSVNGASPAPYVIAVVRSPEE